MSRPTPSETSMDVDIEPLTFCDPHRNARQKVEQDIVRLQAQIQNLRVQRNSFLPISSLPTEVLTQIFALCRVTGKYQWVEIEEMIPLTWVCHHWRNIALSCPSLWAQIGGFSLGWLPQAIERSQQTELVVDLSIGNDEDVVALDLLLTQIHRIRHLELDFGIPYIFREAWTQPAGALEALNLSEATIPVHLFSGNAPLLRKLTLTRCAVIFAPQVLPLSNLRDLSIRDPQIQISVGVMLRALSSIPNLEDLYLSDALTSAESDVLASALGSPSPSHTPFLICPVLKSLQLRDSSVPLVVDFFEHAIIPPTANIFMETTADGDENNFKDVFVLFPRVLSVEVHQASPAGSRVVVKATASSISSTSRFFSLFHSLSWPHLCNLFQDLQIPNLEYLVIHSGDVMPPECWTLISTAFPNLTRLHLSSGLSVRSFMKFVGSSINLEGSDREAFPYLRTLIFCKLRPRDGLTKEEAQEFSEVLGIRRSLGMGLAKLELEKKVNHLKGLNEVVDELVISGTTS